jgi:hypothetical protein
MYLAHLGRKFPLLASPYALYGFAPMLSAVQRIHAKLYANTQVLLASKAKIL